MPRHKLMSSRVSTEDIDDGWEVVVGFGHAAYAVFTPENELITFIGWWQSSNWTRGHLKVLRPISNEEKRGRPEYDRDTGMVVVENKTSQVPDVLPPTKYRFASDDVAAEHGVIAQ